jgi:glucose/arabinose dehydrogenase
MGRAPSNGEYSLGSASMLIFQSERAAALSGITGADFLNFNDRASQVVDIRQGSDGALYMIDWYDINQCHRPQVEAHDFTTGRIYRVVSKDGFVQEGWRSDEAI